MLNMLPLPDVEAEFSFEYGINTVSGYRPAHQIKDDYLTTGLHKYYSNESGIKKLGTITFITPEEYPKSIWVGKELDMYEGAKFIGKAKIIKILNKTLTKLTKKE
ncbi:MAG: hypothetical protein K2J91_06120 [Lachnospiraceae bacterium]|nr:hypothetical protein [Lachnospiraceae bacterium]